MSRPVTQHTTEVNHKNNILTGRTKVQGLACFSNWQQHNTDISISERPKQWHCVVLISFFILYECMSHLSCNFSVISFPALRSKILIIRSLIISVIILLYSFKSINVLKIEPAQRAPESVSHTVVPESTIADLQR